MVNFELIRKCWFGLTFSFMNPKTTFQKTVKDNFYLLISENYKFAIFSAVLDRFDGVTSFDRYNKLRVKISNNSE